MTQKDILTLAQAGFTAQQIAALNQVNTTPEQRTFVPANMPVGGNEGVNAQLQELTKAIQSASLISTQQPKQETTDDILASILMPDGSEVAK